MNIRRWWLPLLLSIMVQVVPIPLLHGQQEMERPALPFTSVASIPGTVTPLGEYDSPCGEPGAGMSVLVSVGGQEYVLTLYQSNQREMRFLLLDNAEGEETPVWIGTVNSETGRLHIRETMTYHTLAAKYANACDIFTQRDA